MYKHREYTWTTETLTKALPFIYKPGIYKSLSATDFFGNISCNCENAIILATAWDLCTLCMCAIQHTCKNIKKVQIMRFSWWCSWQLHPSEITAT